MQKVIYAWNYLEWGGAQTYFFPLIREARKRFDVIVVLPEGSDPQLLQLIGKLDVQCEFMRLPSDQGPAKTFRRKLQRHWRKIRSEFDLIRTIERLGLQDAIVHLDMGPWHSLTVLAWLSIRTRVFITSHNSLPEANFLRRLLWKLKLGFISRFRNFSVFASNKDCREYFGDYYSPALFENIEVIYTSVDPYEIESALNRPFDRESARMRFGIAADQFIVLCVGQFIDRKGRWTFLEAAKMLKEVYADTAFLWIANSMPSKDDIERAESYGLGNDLILLTGSQLGDDHEDLLHMMRMADLFALVSNQEGLSNSLIEAMALGIPSIASNVNALPEAVIHMETGWLVEPADPSGLFKALVALKKDKELRESIATRGQAFVLENFNQHKTAKAVVEHYERSFRR